MSKFLQSLVLSVAKENGDHGTGLESKNRAERASAYSTLFPMPFPAEFPSATDHGPGGNAGADSAATRAGRPEGPWGLGLTAYPARTAGETILFLRSPEKRVFAGNVVSGKGGRPVQKMPWLVRACRG